jgi:hypothetical protein
MVMLILGIAYCNSPIRYLTSTFGRIASNFAGGLHGSNDYCEFFVVPNDSKLMF